MSKFPASISWSRLTLSLKCSASLAACLGLMMGQVCAALTAQSSGAVNMGSVNVGSSQTATVTFTFEQGGELNSTQPYQVVTQGLPGLDFTDAGESTCAANINYATGATCSVNVKFSPRFPGGRYGAVNLYGGAAKIFATGYVYGIGVGPQVEFLPAVQSTLPFTGLVYPASIVADESGNLYIADRGNQRVLKETLANGTYTQTTVANSSSNGLGQVYSIAMDGSGTVYIADQDNTRLLKETPGPSGYIQSEITTPGNPLPLGMYPGSVDPIGVAVDGSGNVYITGGNHTYCPVVKLTLSGAAYTEAPVSYDCAGVDVAVDGNGNVYYDDEEGYVVKSTPTGSNLYPYSLSEVVAGLNVPQQIAVDASDDLYLADQLNNRIVEETPSSGGVDTQSIVLNTGLNYPQGVAVGDGGNIYVADSYNNRILKLATAQPPSLTFAATADGSISSDSPQLITVANIGNAPLTFPVPESGDNPTIPANFTLDSSSRADCALISSGSSASATLAPGASCLLPISFEPKPPAYGSVSGTLNLTDDTLNAASPGYAVQGIALAGTVSAAPPFGSLDTVADSTTDSPTIPRNDTLKVGGWVADPVDHAPLSNVTIYIDGISVGGPTIRRVRTDVAAKHGSSDLDSGYQLFYPVASLSLGSHKLTVVAIDSSGYSLTLGPKSFTVTQ